MNLVSIFLLAIGLSMDSFAVSITNGLTINNLNIKRALIISLSLAIFQSLMPLIGWFVGIGIKDYIMEIDHWVAFLLLSVIGVKMIYDGISSNEDTACNTDLNMYTLICQSIATSIDALVIGVSFALLKEEILTPIMVIGFVTLGISLIGIILGKYLGNIFGKSIEIFGGLILFGIGCKILIEHIYFQ